MNQSETIIELSKSLVKAQAEMSGASKDANNPFFKSSYADLSSVMEACKKPLHENNISVIQGIDYVDGVSFVSCRLLHTSGEWIESKMALAVDKNNMQGLGSAITYGKRYLLQAMAFIPSVDDDGNSASLPKTAGDYVINIGKKHKGKKLKDVQNSELESFAEWLENSAKENGKPLNGAGLEFVKAVEKYLGVS